VGAAPSEEGAALDIGYTSMRHPMFDVMIRAFEEAGAPVSGDLDGTTREGVTQVLLNSHKGLRVSSAVAYLHPAMKRANLRVVTGAHASRIVFEGGRAVGVEYDQGGMRKTVHARREIILSGGTINSPQLLELSGIGDGDLLRAMGVDVVAHSPRVGENLQDHFGVMIRARMKPGSPGLNELSHGIRLLGQMARFALMRTGLLTLGGANLAAFLKSDPALDLPDLQFFASPSTLNFDQLAKNGVMTMEQEPGMTIGSYPMRPQSQGSIHIKSPDFRARPSIKPNFLSATADQRAQVAGLRWTRKVMASPALAPYFDYELNPGPELQSHEDLLAYARASGSSGFHQAGTCAMGAGEEAVISAQLKVNGVQGLRVVDASVMPNIVSGNTNAATMMIAERGSELILADAR
jgi:choline dehydrogenase